MWDFSYRSFSIAGKVSSVRDRCAAWKGLRSGAKSMRSIASLVNRYLPAAALSLYLFSFWVLPRTWDEDNVLDGSWLYALGKFRELGFSLGRDSWFTYGPLAHWFGAPMGSVFHPFPFYLFGLLVAGIVGVYFSRILAATVSSLTGRVIAALLFPFCFIGMDGSQEIHLILALFLLFTWCCLKEQADLGAIALMTLLSSCGMLYKISFGIMSLFITGVLLVSLVLRDKLGLRAVLFYATGYLAILYGLFAVTSGSYDLLTYLVLGLETAGKYSKVMIRNMPYSPQNYLIAFLYLGLGGVLLWRASRKMAGRGGALCMIVAGLGSSLFLFKHGFVRADISHIRLFYASVTPALAVLALISFAAYAAKPRWERVLLCSALLPLMLIYALMLKIFPGENGPVQLARNWVDCGSRLVEGVEGESPGEYLAQKAEIKGRHPELFSLVNDHSRKFGAKGRRPRIAFYPWELMLFEGVEGYELAPSPSLQLYATGPHTRAHRLEAEFLSSPERPDVVVLGPASLDDRSPVSELTTLLRPLYLHYRVIGVAEGYTVLAAEQAPVSQPGFKVTDAPRGVPGEFLQVRLAPEQKLNGLLWQLAAIFFKAPELHVLVTVSYQNGETVEYATRGYLKQLKEGVYFDPDTLPEFFRSSLGQTVTPQQGAPAVSPAIKATVAQLRRGAGFWNLPVIPRSVPLEVSYCSLP